MSQPMPPEPEKPTPAAAGVTIPRWALWVAVAVVGVVLFIFAAATITNLVREAAEKSEADAAAAAEEAEFEDRHANLFQSAISACRETADLALLAGQINIRDGGESLDIDGDGGSDLMAVYQWDHVQCILKNLDAPSSVADRMGSTRALDGTQEAEWDDLIIRWNYHPDNGLDAVIEFKS